MKRNLYIDCDGVIFDTIVIAFSDMELLGIDTKDDLMVTKYFQNIDWINLINRSGQINDSCKKIIELANSNIFNNVAVATHHCSYMEGEMKKVKFNEVLPNIQVFNIPKKIEKHFALKANKNILVDDSLKKITGWVKAGGIGVLFNKDVDTLIYPNDTPYFITNDLSDLVLINDYINEIEKSIKIKVR